MSCSVTLSPYYYTDMNHGQWQNNINVHRSNGNVVLEKNALSSVDRKKRTNLEILNTASSTRKLMSNVKRRQAEFLGHVTRKGKLEHVLTTGKIEGKRSRGRQRIKNTRRYSSLAGKKHCGDVCGCKRSRKVEGHDRLRLQQTRQLKKKKNII